MLGYTKALLYHHSARYGLGDGPIWLDEVKCTGTEVNVAKCKSNEWGVTDCEHHEDVSILCDTERIPGWDIFRLNQAQIFDDRNFKLRLQPLRRHRDTSLHEQGFIINGYLEFQSPDNVWRKVCSDKWTQNNAKVACGQLGYTENVQFNYGSYVRGEPRRGMQYGLNGVQCNGLENNLNWCNNTVLDDRYSYCSNHKPVILKCKPGRHFTDQAKLQKKTVDPLFSRSRQPEDLFVRLKAGGNLGSGRVEIMIDARWGTICHDDWSVSSANVVCRELGFGTAHSAFKNSEFGNGHGPIYWSNVKCKGDEKRFVDCPHTELGEATEYAVRTRDVCNHGHDVSVVCNVPKMEATAENQVRLVNGRHQREGRIEVLVKGHWGPICSNGFTMTTAAVICRQLGFGFSHQFVENLHYWGPSDKALNTPIMSGLSCTGDEASIENCEKHASVVCPSKYKTPFTGLVCTERAGDLVIDTHLLEQSLFLTHVSTGRKGTDHQNNDNDDCHGPISSVPADTASCVTNARSRSNNYKC